MGNAAALRHPDFSSLDLKALRAFAQHLNSSHLCTNTNSVNTTRLFDIYGNSRVIAKTVTQAYCLIDLALLLCSDEQLDAAEEAAASRAIDLLPEKGEQPPVSQSHRVLGSIYRSRGHVVHIINSSCIMFRQDHRIWMAAATFASSSSDVILPQATNTLSPHPVSSRVISPYLPLLHTIAWISPPLSASSNHTSSQICRSTILF